jgi:hypothetical protein
VSLGNRQTDTVGKALTKRTGGDFDTWIGLLVGRSAIDVIKGLTLGVAGLRVTRGLRVELTELPEVLRGKIVSEKVKQGILKSASISQFISLG